VNAREAGADPRLAAAVHALRRTGMVNIAIRYQDDEEPTVWMAVGEWNVQDDGIPVPAGSGGTTIHEVAGGLTPTQAVVRLLNEVVDGGLCMHCRRPVGATEEWRQEMPLANVVCWQVYDPETEKYRRSCEGDVPKRSRNDPCWCGSGEKYKRCHG
jgi:SEC-C motif